MPDYLYSFSRARANGNTRWMSQEQREEHERRVRLEAEYLHLTDGEFTCEVGEQPFNPWSKPEEIHERYRHPSHRTIYMRDQCYPFERWTPLERLNVRRLSQILEELQGLREQLANSKQPEREDASIVQGLQDLRLELQALRVPERERKDYTLPLGSACLAVLVLMLLFK